MMERKKAMEEMEIIDLREYIEVIRKRFWIIVMITVIAVATSGIISYFVLEPVYEVSTTLMVGKAQNSEQMIEYSDVLLSQKLVKTYGEIGKSRAVAKEVIKNLNLDLTPAQFKGKISVNAVGDTEIIMIKVQDVNLRVAVSIANNLTTVFKKNVIKIMKVDNVQIIDEAEIPKGPIKPKPVLNMVIAGFVGIMVGLGITFLLEYLDNTIKTPYDVEKYLELPIIGTIPYVDEKAKG